MAGERIIECPHCVKAKLKFLLLALLFLLLASAFDRTCPGYTLWYLPLVIVP